MLLYFVVKNAIQHQTAVSQPRRPATLCAAAAAPTYDKLQNDVVGTVPYRSCPCQQGFLQSCP